jgi:hypothetical protein
MRIKAIEWAVLISIALFATACGPPPNNPPPTTGAPTGVDTSSSFTITNGTNYTIVYLYMSPTSQSTWGPDQLGSNVLSPGASITLTGISCDAYDIRLVDEDDDECVVNGVSFCAESSGWHITNEMLLSCEGY